jgi:hypothetical protein
MESGAFAITYFINPNSNPSNPQTTSTDTGQASPKSTWSMKITKGEISITIDENGGLVEFVNDNTQKTSSTFTIVRPGEGDKTAYDREMTPEVARTIVVYPVWNGIIVCGGPVSSREMTISFSKFVEKKTAAGKYKQPYSSGFNTAAPDQVIVFSPEDVTVDLSGQVEIEFLNCGGGFAYQPVYFSPVCRFDEYAAMNYNSDVNSRTWTTYPVWTNNATSYTAWRMADPNPYDPGPTGYEGFRFQRYMWSLQNEDNNWQRKCGEIFGEVYHIQETRTLTHAIGNGSFVLRNSGGGTPLDPGSPVFSGYSEYDGWVPYVISFNSTLNLDSCSGSMVIDKAGLFGQESEQFQSVGCLCMGATTGNWSPSYPGVIFTGIANGIGDTISTDGATFNIPLVGMEKKLDDIPLVNVPYFDGEPVFAALQFFCNYGGIPANFSYAPELFDTVPGGAYEYVLSYTDDINTPRFDFKTGTNVKSAISDICNDAYLHFVVRDGQAFFYTLEMDTGLPLHYNDGTIWTGYDGYVMESVNRNPDFDNLRNMTMVMGLQYEPDTIKKSKSDIPDTPVMVKEEYPFDTYPVIPWTRPLLYPVPGIMDTSRATQIMYRLIGKTKRCLFGGSMTIPGNASIRPYDRFNYKGKIYIIYSVSHNVDCTQKKWTTSIELMQYNNPYAPI